ncbi:MAG: tetratricopeptide repeat protein [Pedobacter sp.]|nr:MAG: tetratricopeptide repeat protein [Pedobacter sp.]
MKSKLIPFVLCYLFLSCNNPEDAVLTISDSTENIITYSNDLLREGKNAEALHYLDSASRALSNQNHLDQWYKYRMLMNYYINYEIDIKKATLYNDSMFLALKGKSLVNKLEYAQTLFGRGDIYKADQKLTEAFKDYYDGRAFATKYLNPCDCSDFTNKLGLIRFAQHQYKQAITYFKLALSENSQCDKTQNLIVNFILPQSTLNSIAFSHEQLNMLDSAAIFYKQALSSIDRNSTQKRLHTKCKRSSIWQLGWTIPQAKQHNPS